MGQALSFGLTQNEVDDLRTEIGNKFSQAEIESLYNRFRALDRSHKGFLTKEELLAIPELSINPLNERLASMFDYITFRDFVHLLASMSPKASDEDRLRLIFRVFDQDADDLISAEDLARMLRRLLSTGSFTAEEMDAIVKAAMEEEGISHSGVTFDDMQRIFAGRKFRPSKLEIPTEY